MKTATFPPLRVTPELRRAAESVLDEGETMSAFLLNSIESQIATRRAHREFVERGLAGAKAARESGEYIDAADVIKELSERLAKAKARKAAAVE